MTDNAPADTGPVNQAKPGPDNPSAEFPVCTACGSERVVRDAWASWDTEAQDWQLDAVFDYSFCLACEEEAGMEWRSTPLTKTERIRMLNDAFRIGRHKGGSVVIATGVQAMGPDFVAEARKAVVAFDAFDADSDPHAEHDFGALTVQGAKLFFKVDYYDLDLSAHSPDAADPSVTARVLTIMLASEY
ncbi:MAG: DUF3768 domain-containing protein [Gammaproteobacteria bacterium]|nr:DUF3768 domain-containing protein [Gammaproteobacteria bacterium]